MFTFGTQYLRGATPAKEDWKRDLENIKKHGFNTIRAWLVWNTIEPREGEINEKYLTDFLNIAEDNELQVGLLFHLHASPYWMIKKYSKYFYVDERNLPFEPAVRANTPSGGWPGLCFDNEEVREMEKSLIERVIGVTKGQKSVAFYEPMNEPHSWINNVGQRIKFFCYCPATTKKFQIWLQKKYTTIENLNKAWGYFFGSFDEVRPPRWMTSYTDYTDFRMFMMDNIAEEISFRTDVIRACDNKPVLAHSWGGGSATCALLGASAFDDWKNAKIFDKWGYSAFPTTKHDAVSLGLGCDATRSAANGKEFWQSELTAGLNGTGLDRKGRVDDNTFYNFSLESIRHGAKGLLYWAYRKERYGQEYGGFALTGNNGENTNLTDCVDKLGKILKENTDIFENNVVKDSEVALIFSPRSFLADWCSNWKLHNKFSVDSLSGYYKMFWEENIPVDIIHEEEFDGDLNKYKVVIAPTAYAISNKIAEKIKKYIENGGMFVSDACFGGFDENFNLPYRVPAFGFDKVFGVEEDDFKNSKNVVLKGKKGKFLLRENKLLQTYKNVTAETLYTYMDGSPAIVKNKYGKGEGILSGVNLGFAYSPKVLVSDDVHNKDAANISPDAKKILLDLIKDRNITSNACSIDGIKFSILSANNESDAILILINSTEKRKKGKISLGNTYAEVKSFLNGQFKINKDKLLFEIGANESAVIRLVK